MKVCYLRPVKSGENKRTIKRALLEIRGVTRITDHGGHLKVNGRDGVKIPELKRLGLIQTADKTKHWDAFYWDVAMDAFRHGTTHRQKPSNIVSVVAHYLCNLFDVPEKQLFAMIAAKRDWIDATWTDRKAHGWELDVIAKASKALRK